MSTSKPMLNMCKIFWLISPRWCSASEVDNYNDLCDLIVLEQIKGSLPAHLATYIRERELKTAWLQFSQVNMFWRMQEAQCLVKSTGKVSRGDFGFRPRMSLGFAQEPNHLALRHVPGTNGRYDPTRICHSCKNNGHLKGECPISRAGQKPADSSVYVKSAGLLFSAWCSDMSQSDVLVKAAQKGIDDPLSLMVLCLWMKRTRYWLRFCLTLGLRRASLLRAFCLFQLILLLSEVDIILGNDWAGARVWKDVPPLLYVGLLSQESEEPDECAKQHPKVFSSCAVTQALSKAESEQNEVSGRSSFPRQIVPRARSWFNCLQPIAVTV